MRYLTSEVPLYPPRREHSTASRDVPPESNPQRNFPLWNLEPHRRSELGAFQFGGPSSAHWGPSSEPFKSLSSCSSKTFDVVPCRPASKRLRELSGGGHLRFRAKREHLERLQGLEPGSQVPNLALTVLYVPCSLDSGQDVADFKDFYLKTNTRIWP